MADRLDVQHHLVEVTTEGRCWMTVDKVGTRREYASLHDLVRQTRTLTKLYPDIPKWQVFNGGSNASAWQGASSRAEAPAAPEIETQECLRGCGPHEGRQEPQQQPPQQLQQQQAPEERRGNCYAPGG